MTTANYKASNKAFALLATFALVASLFVMSAMPSDAHAASTHGSAKVTKNVGKAYAKFLKTHKVKNFTVKNIGGGTPALIVNAYKNEWGSGASYYGGDVYLYSKGKVKKRADLYLNTTEGYVYGKRALIFWHNHLANFITAKNGKLRQDSFIFYYSSANGPMYRGFNINNAEYRVNNKLKLTGTKAIDKFYSLKAKYRYDKKKPLKFKANNAKNRKVMLGYK